jgi:hypothetical protein
LQFDPETPGMALPHGNPEFVSAFLHSLPKQYAEFAARSGVAGTVQQSDFARQKLQRLQAASFREKILRSAYFSAPQRVVPKHASDPSTARRTHSIPGARTVMR